MKHGKWLRFLESCVFLLLLCAIVFSLSGLLERKASGNQFGPFLENPQEYDVLFLGDSRFVNCLLPMELWADYGIAGYNLSCYGNTMPVSYWSMMNAFDYAEPDLVVLAINGVRKDLKVTGSSSDLHTALDFYPLTKTKIAAINDLMDDPRAVDDDGNFYADMRWEYAFKLGKYHSRWSELVASDFSPIKNRQRGAEVVVGVAPYQEYTLIDDNLFAEETGDGYAYMRRTIEECQRRGIDVLLVHLPYPASENAQMHANTVGSIAEEYGVRYVDFVRLDSIVDYAVDCYDEQAHLNPSGALKVTDYLGRYIADHYDLPDRRGEAGYAAWAADYDAYVDEKLYRLSWQGDQLANVLMLLHDDDFDVRMGVRPNAPMYWDDQAILLMHNIAREHVYEADEYAMASSVMYPLEVFDEASWENWAYFLETDGGQAREWSGEEAAAQIESVFADRKGHVLIEVVDRRTGKVGAELAF